MIAGKGEYKVVLDLAFAFRRAETHRPGKNLLNAAAKIRRHFAVGNTVLDVRLDPVLYVFLDRRAAMHQRDPRPAPPELQGGDRRRVLAADHQHIGIEVW